MTPAKRRLPTTGAPRPRSPRTTDPDAIGGHSGSRFTKQKRPAPLTWAEASCCVLSPWQRRYTLPVSESANRIWRNVGHRTIKSRLGRDNRQSAQARFRATPLSGELAVLIVWIRARKAGDSDNRIKATLDLLKGLAYADDASVADLRIVRIDDATEPPRMEVFVSIATPPTLAVLMAPYQQTEAA